MRSLLLRVDLQTAFEDASSEQVNAWLNTVHDLHKYGSPTYVLGTCTKACKKKI